MNKRKGVRGEGRKGDRTLWELWELWLFLSEICLIIICPSVYRWQFKSGFYFLSMVERLHSQLCLWHQGQREIPLDPEGFGSTVLESYLHVLTHFWTKCYVSEPHTKGTRSHILSTWNLVTQQFHLSDHSQLLVSKLGVGRPRVCSPVCYGSHGGQNRPGSCWVFTSYLLSVLICEMLKNFYYKSWTPCIG